MFTPWGKSSFIKNFTSILRPVPPEAQATDDVKEESNQDNSAGPAQIMASPETGRKLIDLLTWSQDWMYRRVDSIRLDERGVTRRHVSIDFSLPNNLVIHESDHRILLPITFLEKGTISRLDTNKVGSKHVSVLNTAQNRMCAMSLLISAAERYLPIKIPEYELRDQIEQVVNFKGADHRKVQQKFAKWVRATQVGVEGGSVKSDDIELFISMATQFADKFLFVVSVDNCIVGDRSVLKFSFDQASPDDEPRGTMRTLIRQNIPDFGMAQSQHIEVRVPPELVIEYLHMYDIQGKKIYGKDLDRANGERDTAHCSLTPSSRDAQGKWLLSVRPADQGLYSFTKTCVNILAFLFLVGSVIRIFDAPIVNWSDKVFPSPAVSIILVGPAILLSWLSRQREHAISARVQAPLRGMLVLCSAALVTLAVLASVPLRDAAWEVGWFAAGVVTAAGWAWLLLYRRDVSILLWARKLKALLRHPDSHQGASSSSGRDPAVHTTQ